MKTETLIKSLIKAERANASAFAIYELIGRLGDKLTEDIKKDMYRKANEYQKEHDRIQKQISGK